MIWLMIHSIKNDKHPVCCPKGSLLKSVVCDRLHTGPSIRSLVDAMHLRLPTHRDPHVFMQAVSKMCQLDIAPASQEKFISLKKPADIAAAAVLAAATAAAAASQQQRAAPNAPRQRRRSAVHAAAPAAPAPGAMDTEGGSPLGGSSNYSSRRPSDDGAASVAATPSAAVAAPNPDGAAGGADAVMQTPAATAAAPGLGDGTSADDAPQTDAGKTPKLAPTTCSKHKGRLVPSGFVEVIDCLLDVLMGYHGPESVDQHNSGGASAAAIVAANVAVTGTVAALSSAAGGTGSAATAPAAAQAVPPAVAADPRAAAAAAVFAALPPARVALAPEGMPQTREAMTRQLSLIPGNVKIQVGQCSLRARRSVSPGAAHVLSSGSL